MNSLDVTVEDFMSSYLSVIGDFISTLKPAEMSVFISASLHVLLI